MAMLVALAVVINIVENTFLPPVQFGIRFGLANVISIISMVIFSYKEMLIVNSLRLVVSNLLRGYLFATSFWIAAGGLALSSLTIYCCFLFKRSIIFTAILSSFAHTLGQLLVVSFIYKQVDIIYLAPELLLFSFFTGILTGRLSTAILKHIKVKEF